MLTAGMARVVGVVAPIGPVQKSLSFPTIEGWLSALVSTVARCDGDTADIDAALSTVAHAPAWIEARVARGHASMEARSSQISRHQQWMLRGQNIR